MSRPRSRSSPSLAQAQTPAPGPRQSRQKPCAPRESHPSCEVGHPLHGVRLREDQVRVIRQVRRDHPLAAESFRDVLIRPLGHLLEGDYVLPEAPQLRWAVPEACQGPHLWSRRGKARAPLAGDVDDPALEPYFMFWLASGRCRLGDSQTRSYEYNAGQDLPQGPRVAHFRPRRSRRPFLRHLSCAATDARDRSTDREGLGQAPGRFRPRAPSSVRSPLFPNSILQFRRQKATASRNTFPEISPSITISVQFSIDRSASAGG